MLREGSQRQGTLQKSWRGDGTKQGAARAEIVAEAAEAGSPKEMRKQTSVQQLQSLGTRTNGTQGLWELSLLPNTA